ncbi:MAG: hypothetical protein L6Q37_01320 [Bdellovibrionaceae bacterium]|nr:hypothetical protein [Pseudobdellovibrionaceae bacterium]NUM59385.1 hypothetical protein [Pseudobdellovibrionaceae bacterium]
MRFFKNVTTIIILVTFCSLKGFANQCSSLYTATSNITRGYLQHVNNMKLTGEHTIKNPVAYLKDNLGEVFLNSLIKKDFGFITIALGNGPEALETAKKNGLQLEELIEKKVGFHKIRKVTNSKGEQGYLIYRVNGYDREIHIQSFFKMLNVPDNKIITIGKNKNWEKDLTNFFTELGPPPSLVVYGFSEAAVLGLILKHPISNLKFIPKAYRVLKPKKTPLTDQQSDLEGRPIQIIL